MKKPLAIFTFSVLLFSGASTMISCSDSSNSNTENHTENKHYQCPMDCEEGKTYEEAGKCPVCGMNLAEI